MRISIVTTILTLAGFCLAANAASPDNIAVYSTENSQGSMSIGNKDAYTKTFEVSLINLSEESINLDKLCLKAYSSERKVFKLDTVDEKLSRGRLGGNKALKGIAIFTSDNADVFKANLIKISADCQ